MRRFYKMSLFLILTISSWVANATVFLKPSFMYLQNSSDTGSGSSTNARTLIDFAFAYSTDKGWTTGLLYGTDKASSSGNTDYTRTSYGPMVGWVSTSENGLYSLLTYFTSSEYYGYKGTGIELDVGYRFAIRRSWMGFQLSYKDFTYSTTMTGGGSTTLNPPLKYGYIDPYFAMFFAF